MLTVGWFVEAVASEEEFQKSGSGPELVAPTAALESAGGPINNSSVRRLRPEDSVPSQFPNQS